MTEFTVVLHKQAKQIHVYRPNAVSQCGKGDTVMTELEYLLPHPGAAAVGQLASS